jgi:hypothetical protein
VDDMLERYIDMLYSVKQGEDERSC